MSTQNTPWHIDNGVNVSDSNEYGICHTRVDSKLSIYEQQANAAHIVKCVNLHEELVRALAYNAELLRIRLRDLDAGTGAHSAVSGNLKNIEHLLSRAKEAV